MGMRVWMVQPCDRQDVPVLGEAPAPLQPRHMMDGSRHIPKNSADNIKMYFFLVCFWRGELTFEGCDKNKCVRSGKIFPGRGGWADDFDGGGI